MELKEFEGLETKIREWAGNDAKIELKYNPTSSCEDAFYITISNDKVTCLVNVNEPDKPYGLYFDDDDFKWETIKGFFKDGKK